MEGEPAQLGTPGDTSRLRGRVRAPGTSGLRGRVRARAVPEAASRSAASEALPSFRINVCLERDGSVMSLASATEISSSSVWCVFCCLNGVCVGGGFATTPGR